VKTDKLYLVGFMATGKTSVARALGGRLGWRVEDVDNLIEARERLAVADIFARHGEAYFRRVERDIVKLLLPLRHTVVATGGGTFADADTRAAINLDGMSIWLDAPLDVILLRLPADGRRPLAADRTQLDRLYAARRVAYAEAHVRLDASAARPEEIADRIIDWLQDR
jgi:shikimate kinase